MRGSSLPYAGAARTPLGHQAARRWRSRRHLLHHVINGDSLAQALQCDLADLLQLRVLFDRHRDTATDQYLPVLGLATQASGEVGDRPDGGVVHSLGKADLAQGRVPLRDANAEAEIMAASM